MMCPTVWRGVEATATTEPVYPVTIVRKTYSSKAWNHMCVYLLPPKFLEHVPSVQLNASERMQSLCLFHNLREAHSSWPWTANPTSSTDDGPSPAQERLIGWAHSQSGSNGSWFVNHFSISKWVAPGKVAAGQIDFNPTAADLREDRR